MCCNFTYLRIYQQAQRAPLQFFGLAHGGQSIRIVSKTRANEPASTCFTQLDTGDLSREIEFVWDGYSTRQAAELVGLPESIIRGCVRAGFLVPDKHAVGMTLSFRDLRILRSVKDLVAGGVPLRRLRRQLSALKRRLPETASLAELSLAAHGSDVVVRERQGAWLADTGQLVLRFESNESRGQVHAMPIRREAAGPEMVPSMGADEWIERAQQLEEIDSGDAVEAYQHALELRPDSLEAWINLGRLHAEEGDTREAEACFRRALKLDPSDPTVIYNLGVVAQDAGNETDAIQFYEHALCLEPSLAEAHYNLATIYDRNGDTATAIRHINEYRKLVQKAR